MGKLKAEEETERGGVGGEGEEGRVRGGVACERISEDGMRSDGEGSDRAEEEAPSPQVRLSSNVDHTVW